MAKVDVKLNSKGVTELLRSSEMQAIVAEKATAIAAAAGPGHGHDSERGRNRVRATVWTDTFAAIQNESRNHNLTRAIDAGRR